MPARISLKEKIDEAQFDLKGGNILLVNVNSWIENKKKALSDCLLPVLTKIVLILDTQKTVL